MHEIIVATPLHHGVVDQPHTFDDGISIRKLSLILWDKATIKRYVSDDERDFMNKDRFWLCAARTVEYVLPDTGDEPYDKALHAAWALQVLCPCGAKHVFLKFGNTPEGFDNIGARRPKELCSTRLSFLYTLGDRGIGRDFDKVYTGVNHAFTEKIVRLQNPILLIEHGMQTGNAPLATLMFAMALDMLFMVGETTRFVSRIGGCLGLDSFIFAAYRLGYGGTQQPDVRVRDVLDRVYSFRNIIAHGGEIPKVPYREHYTLKAVDGLAIVWDDFSYVQLLLDSTLSMLTTAVRSVFTEGWVDDAADKGAWKARMTLFEHRYKNAGGLAILKGTGR
jgi:hypothetical protein